MSDPSLTRATLESLLIATKENAKLFSTYSSEQGEQVLAGEGGSADAELLGISALCAFTNTGMTWPVVRLKAGFG